MKKEIKLTQKQQKVLEVLETILEKENFKKIPVSDIYCEMTAVKKIVAPNWFDRTFKVLEDLGLVEKEDMKYEIKDGYKKGEIVETYCYNLTELGLEYLGIEKGCTKQELETVFKLVAEGYKTTEEIAKVSGMDIFRVEWTLAKLHITSYIKCSMTKGIEITKKGYKQLEIWKAREEITVNDIEVLKQIAEGKDTNKNMAILKKLNTAGYITTKGTKTNFKCNTTKKGLEFILFNK